MSIDDEPSISAKEPSISAKEPSISAKEPYIESPEAMSMSEIIHMTISDMEKQIYGKSKLESGSPKERLSVMEDFCEIDSTGKKMHERIKELKAEIKKYL